MAGRGECPGRIWRGEKGNVQMSHFFGWSAPVDAALLSFHTLIIPPVLVCLPLLVGSSGQHGAAIRHIIHTYPSSAFASGAVLVNMALQSAALFSDVVLLLPRDQVRAVRVVRGVRRGSRACFSCQCSATWCCCYRGTRCGQCEGEASAGIAEPFLLPSASPTHPIPKPVLFLLSLLSSVPLTHPLPKSPHTHRRSGLPRMQRRCWS